jgi:hypothetical protein
MHARIPEVLPGGVVPDGGEPDEAFLVEIDAERVVRRHGHVQAQVPLVAVDQQRVVDVLGDNLKIRVSTKVRFGSFIYHIRGPSLTSS